MWYRQVSGIPVRKLWEEKVSIGETTGAHHFAFDHLSRLSPRKKELCLPRAALPLPNFFGSWTASVKTTTLYAGFLCTDWPGVKGNMIPSSSLPWSGNGTRRRAVESSIQGLWDQSRAKTAGTRRHFMLGYPTQVEFISAMQMKVRSKGPFWAKTMHTCRRVLISVCSQS